MTHPYWHKHSGDYYMTDDPSCTMRVANDGKIIGYDNIGLLIDNPKAGPFIFYAGPDNGLRLHGNIVETGIITLTP